MTSVIILADLGGLRGWSIDGGSWWEKRQGLLLCIQEVVHVVSILGLLILRLEKQIEHHKTKE